MTRSARFVAASACIAACLLGPLAAALERGGELREGFLDDGAVGRVVEQRVESLAHRALGPLQRGATRGGDREAYRASIAADRRALDHAVGDERVDPGRHGGSGECELAGEAARTLLAAHDQGEEAVLREGQLGAGPLELTRHPRERQEVEVQAVPGLRLGRAHGWECSEHFGTLTVTTLMDSGRPPRGGPIGGVHPGVMKPKHAVSTFTGVVDAQPSEDVVLIRWPEEEARLERLRAVGAPRLLLVGEALSAPTSVDPLEDWIRLPAAEDDLRTRVATLAARAGQTVAAPTVDVDGILRHRGQWVTLSPVERALASALVDRFGAVVGRDTLVRRAWPGGSPTRNALDVHMLRLRRRIATLGLEVRTVRARGYLLQAVEGEPPGT